MNGMFTLWQSPQRHFLFGALVGALAGFGVAITVAAYAVPRMEVRAPQSDVSTAAAASAASAITRQSDQWYLEAQAHAEERDRRYLETQAQPLYADALRAQQRDRWYLEAQAEAGQRDRWYLETQAQPYAPEGQGEPFIMAGAREHYIQMKLRPAP